MKPKVLDGSTVREMTDAEYEQHLSDLERWAQENATLAQKEAATMSARSKLAALGLTDDEIAALVGV